MNDLSHKFKFICGVKTSYVSSIMWLQSTVEKLFIRIKIFGWLITVTSLHKSEILLPWLYFNTP
jgi:hypothetical protein